MLTVNFVVPGAPVAKGRARSAIRHGHVMHYTPEKTANYESLVRLAASRAMGHREPGGGSVELIVLLQVPIPQSWSRKKREAALAGAIRPKTKPDCSNVLKAIEDAMNGIVYIDDAQIADVTVRKRYAAIPEAIVQVSEVSNEGGAV